MSQTIFMGQPESFSVGTSIASMATAAAGKYLRAADAARTDRF